MNHWINKYKNVLLLGILVLAFQTTSAQISQNSVHGHRLSFSVSDFNETENNYAASSDITPESLFNHTDGPFSIYLKTVNEINKKPEPVQIFILNEFTQIKQAKELSYHKRHTFNCSVKGVCSHKAQAKEKKDMYSDSYLKHKFRRKFGKSS